MFSKNSVFVMVIIDVLKIPIKEAWKVCRAVEKWVPVQVLISAGFY